VTCENHLEFRGSGFQDVAGAQRRAQGAAFLVNRVQRGANLLIVCAWHQGANADVSPLYAFWKSVSLSHHCVEILLLTSFLI
jgi:hypothetical protein